MTRPIRKQLSTMFQDTPIYGRLVAERGDVPAQVRAAAERILRQTPGTVPTGAVRTPHAKGLSLVKGGVVVEAAKNR